MDMGEDARGPATLPQMFHWAAERNLASPTPFKRSGKGAVTVRGGVRKGRESRVVLDEEQRLLALRSRTYDVIIAVRGKG